MAAASPSHSAELYSRCSHLFADHIMRLYPPFTVRRVQRHRYRMNELLAGQNDVPTVAVADRPVRVAVVAP